MKRKLYRELTGLIDAHKTCVEKDNYEWIGKHEDRIIKIMDGAPSGSGIDCGTKLLSTQCTTNKLVFSFSYHHMDQWGGYCGWSEHTLTVTPSLLFEIDLDFQGDFDGTDLESLIACDECDEEEENEAREVTKEDIQWIEESLYDYLNDVYHCWLMEEIENG